MNEKNKKSSLEEAKLNYEEIQRFAEEQAAGKLKEQVEEKLKELFESKLNEDITINIDGDENVEVKKDGAVVTTTQDIESNLTDDSEEAKTTMGLDPESAEEFIVSDEEDAIALDDTIEETIQNQNMEEMNKMTMEQDANAMPTPTAAPTTDAAAVPGAEPTAIAPEATPETPEATIPMPAELLSKLDTLINMMMQQQGGAPAPDASNANAAAGTDQEFQVIDDEAGAAPTADATPAPVQEEEIEIVDFETDNANANFIDEMENQMLEVVDEDETPTNGPSMEETRGLSFTSKRTGDKNLKLDTMKDEKGHHAPVTSLKENKAQKESNVDELVKENKGLKKQIESLNKERKEFEEAFVDLREQFNEMQLFNGKLALVNKLFMNGGLTQEDKMKICEQFDSVQTPEEASKLFKKIIKENNIRLDEATAKLKSTSTKTAQPKSKSEPLYESEEARRAKKLAGIIKSEDEE